MPLLGRLSKWADEDPKAMRYLLTDPELRADLLKAIDEVMPKGEGQEEGFKAGSGVRMSFGCAKPT